MAEEKNTKEKKVESKVEFEREYIVPLRDEWLKVPTYKRANKAVKALKQFMVRHMKVYDRDLRKIRVDILLNNELRFRGMQKPPAHIKVKAIKYADGFVDVKLVNLPKHIEFELARKARKETEKLASEKEKPKEEKSEQKTEEKKSSETAEQKEDAKEKETSSKEATQIQEKSKAKEIQHTSGMKKAPIIQRKSLKK